MTGPLTAEEQGRLNDLDLTETALIPINIGPTWQRNEAGSWLLPEKTLGWQIIGWCARYLRDDDGNPWNFTNEQMRFILHWYSLKCDGSFRYRSGVLQRMKGWGKDPLLACLSLVEMCGPSRFSHWDEGGKAVGKRHPRPWIQIAAVSQSQTKNTMRMLPTLAGPEMAAEFGLVVRAETAVAFHGTATLDAITSNYRTLEGGRSTFVVLNETHHWIASNGGHKMYETLKDNTTKMDGRILAITNAYIPGEASVAEMMRSEFRMIEEGIKPDVGFMYDSLEAHEKAPIDPILLPRILRGIRGDAIWLSIESIMANIQAGMRSAARTRRMWLNQVVAEEDAVYALSTWTDLKVGFEDELLRPGDKITLGFDGGKTDDATALVGVRMSDGFVQILGLWERPYGPEGEFWEINRGEVNSRVHEAFQLYSIQGFYADVTLWQGDIADWSRAYGDQLAVKASGSSPIGWDMKSQKKSTEAHENLMQAVYDKRIHHNGDLALQRHVMNARRATNSWGISFRKETPDSPKKVDAYAALLLAYHALNDMKVRGKDRGPKRQAGIWAF